MQKIQSNSPSYFIIPMTFITFLFLVSCGKEGSNKGITNANTFYSNTDYVEQLPSFSSQGVFTPLETYQKKPNPASSSYTQVDIAYQKNKYLNYQTFPKGLRVIRIKGKIIHLNESQTGNSSELYLLLKETYDVSKLIIEAEKVYISSPLKLRQANVLIKANTVIFNHEGQIDITPLTLNSHPSQFQNGKDGLSAGEIKLIVDDLQILNKKKTILVANGGTGQPAGHGQDGARGTNANIVHSDKYYFYQEEYCERDRVFERPNHQKALEQCWWKDPHSGRAAGNGKDARVGGKPGEPGNAGNIISTVDIASKSSKAYQLIGGNAGKSDIKRIGGQPGTPVKTCKLRKHFSNKTTTYDCIVARKGKDVAPKHASRRRGSVGKLNLISGDWLNDGYIVNQLDYAKDLYISHYFELADYELESLKRKMIKSSHKSIVKMKALAEVQKMKTRLGMHLDYYGNARGWVPNFNLGITYVLFEKEVRRNINLILKTKSLLTGIENQSQKQILMRDLQEEKLAEINENVEQINNLSPLQSSLQLEFKNLEVAREEFEFELSMLEKEIEQMARRNLEVPFMEKAVRFLAVAAQAIPVGQPTFAAAGIGLDFVYRSMEGNSSTDEILREFSSISANFEGFDWKKAKEDLKKEIKSIHFSDLKKRLAKASNDEERKKIKYEHFQSIQNLTLGIYGEVAKEVESWKQRETDQRALSVEINRIKESHPLYQKVIGKLEELLFQKQTILMRIQSFQSQLSDLVSTIENNYLMISELADEHNSYVQYNLNEFSNNLKLIHRSAYDRIRYYRYLLAKSYNYHVLKQYPVLYNSTRFVNKFEKILANVTEFKTSQTDEIFTFFENELSEVVESMVFETERNGVNRILSKEYLLQKHELQKINDGETIYLDFGTTDFFGLNKEDIRLIKIELLDGFRVEKQASDADLSGDFEMVFSHLGRSIINKNGQSFKFVHDPVGSSSQFYWSSYYNLYTGQLHNSQIDLNHDSLLYVFLNRKHGEGSSTTIRPGARSLIKVKLNKDSDVNLSDVVIRINYSYRNVLK